MSGRLRTVARYPQFFCGVHLLRPPAPALACSIVQPAGRGINFFPPPLSTPPQTTKEDYALLPMSNADEDEVYGSGSKQGKKD